jgi:hypothetical protein
MPTDENPTFLALYYANFWFSVFFIDTADLFLSQRRVIRFHNIWQLGHKLNATFLVL